MIKWIYLILALGMYLSASFFPSDNNGILLTWTAIFGAFFLQELSADNRISKLNDSINELHLQMVIDELLLVECRDELKIKGKKYD